MIPSELEPLTRCRLFSGIPAEELPALLRRLGADRKRYGQDRLLLTAAEADGRVGVLLQGEVQIVREEFSGARTLLACLGPGELFGEAFACASGGAALPCVSARAAAPCAVLWVDFGRALAPSAQPCGACASLVANMLAVLADKNLLLNRRLEHLSKRTTREKLLSYLAEQARLCGGPSFSIPLDRQELADYLCVERSAMSAALGKLRDEGLVSFQRNHFILAPGFQEHS